MKTYLYSILVRFFLAFSGFLVFLLTAYLYGADGRGVIGYGTSLFAITGIIFSGNLGRAFLSRTRQNDELKQKQLGGFLLLNLVLSLFSSLAGLVYWSFSSTAQEMLTGPQVLFFSLTGFFHVWSVNGNSFFASFLATKKQENIILAIRLLLIFFLSILYVTHQSQLSQFIVGYSFVLFGGVILEIAYLFKKFSHRGGSQFSLTIRSSIDMLKDSFYHHLDHLFFYLFPLVLTVLCASYISKGDVGRFNFALQIISLIFLFSATANIRITAYVSDVGYRARIVQYKKLFWATFLISGASVFIITLGLSFATRYMNLRQFEGVQWLFLICAISIPGYVVYQFFSPIWVELKKERRAALAHGSVFLVCISLAPLMLAHSGLEGLPFLFSSFYCALILAEYGLYRLYVKGN